jgi:hypothetical protein
LKVALVAGPLLKPADPEPARVETAGPLHAELVTSSAASCAPPPQATTGERVTEEENEEAAHLTHAEVLHALLPDGRGGRGAVAREEEPESDSAPDTTERRSVTKARPEALTACRAEMPSPALPLRKKAVSDGPLAGEGVQDWVADTHEAPVAHGAHPCAPPYENVWDGQAVQLTAIVDQLLSDCLDVVTTGPYAPAAQRHVYAVADSVATGVTAFGYVSTG